jgi:5,5'-dehydrodivanillate O-demethylase
MTPALPPLSLGVDLTSTRPGTPGGTFMRRFWLAIARGEDLMRGEAKPIRIMSEDYVLYRGISGQPRLIAQRCPHRGAPLHLGWVEGEHIRCVYHGWKFDGAGECVEQPAEDPGFCRKVQIATRPVREHMGLVFAYLGEGDPPEFPPYPAPPQEGLIEAWPVERVPCNYLQCFENTMDEVHVAFVHAPGGSHRAMSDLPLISAEETGWGMIRYGKRKSGKVRVTLHYAPAVTRVIVPPLTGMEGVGGWTEIYFNFTPVDDENHLWLITHHVKVTGESATAYRRKRVEYLERRAMAPPALDVALDLTAGKGRFADVLGHPDLAIVQDIAVQAGQGRIQDRSREHLGRSDAGIIAWRRILARELSSIAAGRSGKAWRRPPPDALPELGI